ncbi:DUF3575 domain-containing protein [uncultured Muribaculum sp.]
MSSLYQQGHTENLHISLGKGHHNYFGPTKAAINLVYVF